jgi:hypothetical protein
MLFCGRIKGITTQIKAIGTTEVAVGGSWFDE